MDMQKSKLSIERIIITAWLLIVLVFYFWTASTNLAPFKFDFSDEQEWYRTSGYQEKSYIYYNYLSDAFLAGQLHLLIKPSEQLLSVKDPYEPEQNAYISLLDASLYNNQYYFYFGPSPALCFFIPYRLFFSGKMPANFAAALISYLGLLFSILLLNFSRKRYFERTPFLLFFSGVVALSLCTFIPFALRRPSSYEIAILGAYFFVMGAFYLIISGTLGKAVKKWKLLLGSISLGLAVGSRPTTILASLLLVFMFVYVVKEYKDNRFSKAVPEFILLSLPYGLIIFLLGLYNYLRFDNWFEFGQSWQLTLQNMREISMYKFANFFPNLLRYLFKPIDIISTFPYFTIGHKHTYEGGFSLEPVAGILLALPIVLMIIIFFIDFKKIRKENVGLFYSMVSIIGSATLVLLFVSFYSAVTMRYAIDFTPLFLVAALLSWFYFYQKVNNVKIELEKRRFHNRITQKKSKKADKPVKNKDILSLDKSYRQKRLIFTIISIFAVSSIVYSSIANVFMSFAGYHNNLLIGNPSLYHSLQSLF